MSRYPAVKLSGNIYVAIHPMYDAKTNRRVPPRHTDALTNAIRIVAGSNAPDHAVQQLIKQIDMGKVTVDYGNALADGSGFISIMEEEEQGHEENHT